MQNLPSGIAHISFAGGSTFVPARSPYDRELLVENVLDRVRVKGRVQVLLSNERWLVCQARGGCQCAACGGGTDAPCYRTGAADSALCVSCAFGDRNGCEARGTAPCGQGCYPPAAAANAVNSRATSGPIGA
jgi:hypothetical protein